MAHVGIGDPGPDFELPASDGTTYRLSDLRGTTVVLAFYPGDMTPVCTKQLCSYTDRWDELTEQGTLVLGISRQDLDSHARFAQKYGLKVPLLADTSGEVIDAYGVGGPLGFTQRAVFLIDADGIVRWSSRSVTGIRYVKPSELVERVRAL